MSKGNEVCNHGDFEYGQFKFNCLTCKYEEIEILMSKGRASKKLTEKMIVAKNLEIENLKHRLQEADKVIRQVEMYGRVNHNIPKDYLEVTREYFEKYKADKDKIIELQEGLIKIMKDEK